MSTGLLDGARSDNSLRNTAGQRVDRCFVLLRTYLSRKCDQSRISSNYARKKFSDHLPVFVVKI